MSLPKHETRDRSVWYVDPVIPAALPGLRFSITQWGWRDCEQDVLMVESEERVPGRRLRRGWSTAEKRRIVELTTAPLGGVTQDSQA
jgi:hypothetical protein